MKKLLLILLCVWGFFGIGFATPEPFEQEQLSGHARFDSDKLFPSWDIDSEKETVEGVIGENKNLGAVQETDKLAMGFLPRILGILMKFVAPIVVVVFIWTGIRLIYAGSNDEEREKAKDMFQYAAIGLAFIVLSYTVVKIIYSFLVG